MPETKMKQLPTVLPAAAHDWPKMHTVCPWVQTPTSGLSLIDAVRLCLAHALMGQTLQGLFLVFCFNFRTQRVTAGGGGRRHKAL